MFSQKRVNKKGGVDDDIFECTVNNDSEVTATIFVLVNLVTITRRNNNNNNNNTYIRLCYDG